LTKQIKVKGPNLILISRPEPFPPADVLLGNLKWKAWAYSLLCFIPEFKNPGDEMKKTKAKPKKEYKSCAGCGAMVLSDKGKLLDGKFYCAEDCK